MLSTLAVRAAHADADARGSAFFSTGTQSRVSATCAGCSGPTVRTAPTLGRPHTSRPSAKSEHSNPCSQVAVGRRQRGVVRHAEAISRPWGFCCRTARNFTSPMPGTFAGCHSVFDVQHLGARTAGPPDLRCQLPGLCCATPVDHAGAEHRIERTFTRQTPRCARRRTFGVGQLRTLLPIVQGEVVQHLASIVCMR